MSKWSVVIAILGVAIGYQIYANLQNPIPADLEDGDKIAVLDAIGRLGNRLMLTAARFDVNLATYKPVKFLVDNLYSLILNGISPGPYNDVEIQDTTIADVPVRVFIPRRKKTALFPAMIYLHGGGWSWLSVDVYSRFLSHLCNATSLMIIAPRYRQAPEHVYPVTLDECRRVTWATLAGKSRFPIHPSYVILAGDEAGGNMAASLATEFRSKIFMQILLNPMLQMFDFLTPSYQDHQEVLTGITSPSRSAVQWLMYSGGSVGWFPALLQNAHRFPSPEIMKHQTYLDSNTYLPSHLKLTKSKSVQSKAYDSSVSNALKASITSESLCPALTNNVIGVPNTYIVTSQFDVFRDEAVMYISRLHKHSASKVKLKHYKKAFHGFFPFAGNKGWFQFKVSDEALQDLTEFISYQVHRLMKNPTPS
ncbi:arylacetamide deacetylase-like isoform X1 [Ostrea edulis]|uniref:arylacetamide deacetylase-like isoform X1 n=1 Tax=Ostrea edulis TaxID=37623 RepID=UPI0024AEC1BC|nr:arylacetamide deacetylase-like isoform X1 [Ostrea edulis]